MTDRDDLAAILDAVEHEWFEETYITDRPRAMLDLADAVIEAGWTPPGIKRMNLRTEEE